MRSVAAALMVGTLAASARADLSCGDPKGSACINHCYRQPQNQDCVAACNQVADPTTLAWCGSLCSDPKVSAQPFCTTQYPPEVFHGPALFFQIVGELTGRVYSSQGDGTFALVPTVGARVTSALSIIARGWAGIGGGSHTGGVTFSAEGGGGIGIDLHLFDIIRLHQDPLTALDFSLVAGPWVGSCNGLCAWTPALISAQLGFTPRVVRNAPVSSYTGLLFGVEGGAGYDIDTHLWIARFGLYVGIGLSAK